ncbi:Kinesin-like protein KIN-7F [Sesamum alatum]|uniref:Kinesin-like protein n=1 Tax=Sesamum alatum TaxID=300844 RepID=A0AAE1YFP9_9LAMI|nr:Kinesin-like protein KIN-7F [Sesamum alatum]
MGGSIIGFGEDLVDWYGQDSSAQEEKIFVAVRVRPLNERELGKNDVSDWECINSTTIVFKNSLAERSLLPTAHTFDRVFGTEAPTRQVYEEAAKKIALSVLSGMNSTIFAYGQTSSGKTYTMTGITEYTHSEREFVLKFSAMEIYNEAVKDLLSPDGGPLRLLDDPERGTVVDKLIEVTLRDFDHLRELLSVCEAQRQIGETTLNEMSSRSHQILRLTVDSEAREYLGRDNSSVLTATVNFVDLAGSERASQTLSAGTRLKEGCHINRSLLTLGTVIRKLSKGRNGHIPYRDSKLTRILQNSLGGNARTAIICTMSPAHSHVEQSRNTLLFASCAKQVSTNAQVNLVMSEKALVKQLQRELARLENELRNLSSVSASSSASALKEKELLIEKMSKEIKDLKHQRDLAQSRLQNMLRAAENPASKSWADMGNHEKGSWGDEYPTSEASEMTDPLRSDAVSRGSHLSDKYEGVIPSRIEDNFPENNEEQFLSGDTSPRLYIDKYFGPDPCKGWEKMAEETRKNFEDNCKDVQCIEIDFTKRNVVSSEPSSEKGDDHVSGQSPCLSDNNSPDPSANVKRCNSCAAILTTATKSASSDEEKENENTLQNEADNQEKLSDPEPVANSENLYTEETQPSVKADFMNEDDQNISNDCSDKQQEAPVKELNEVIKQQEAPVKELNEVIKQQEVPVKELNEVIETKPVTPVEYDLDMKEERTPNNAKQTTDGGSDETQDTKQSASDWQTEFQRQKKEIIELWDACHTPLVHRTYFFLLFKGDPSDAVYLEVELRRLQFLKNTMLGGVVVKDDQSFKLASSVKALNREREMLSKRMLKRYSVKEREDLFEKWGIDVKSKQRRIQLCRRLWTDPTNMDHITESAIIVAKLVGFQEPGQAPKEMFGLSFSPKPANVKSFSWRHTLPSMM